MRRRIIAFGSYYYDFMKTLSEKESKKIEYVLSLLESEDRMPVKFIKHIREHGNISRVENGDIIPSVAKFWEMITSLGMRLEIVK